MNERTFDKARQLAQLQIEFGAMVELARPDVERIQSQIAHMRSIIKASETAIAILEKSADAKRAEIAELERQILEEMAGADRGDYQGVSITVKSAGGVQALEIDEPYKSEPAKLPERYHERKIVANTDLIREDLAEGPLAFARLLPRKRTVAVEVKDE